MGGGFGGLPVAEQGVEFGILRRCDADRGCGGLSCSGGRAADVVYVCIGTPVLFVVSIAGTGFNGTGCSI